jgi:hypothetical protein
MGEQTVVYDAGSGRVVACDSAYDANESNRAADVVVNSSYSGVLPARFVAEHRPRGAIGMDCAVGPEGSAIAGLWFYEGAGIPAATADVMTAHLGDGVHLYEHGIISHRNELAASCGVEVGMTVRDAAALLLTRTPNAREASQITNRTVMDELPNGRKIVCTDSIAFGLSEDVDNVLLTAGHTGRSAVPYLRQVQPFGFICSDGGMGADESGVAGIYIVEADGLCGATVDARTARMGDGLSTWYDGVISAANVGAQAKGVRVGMSAKDAAYLLAENG